MQLNSTPGYPGRINRGTMQNETLGTILSQYTTRTVDLARSHSGLLPRWPVMRSDYGMARARVHALTMHTRNGHTRKVNTVLAEIRAEIQSAIDRNVARQLPRVTAWYNTMEFDRTRPPLAQAEVTPKGHIHVCHSCRYDVECDCANPGAWLAYCGECYDGKARPEIYTTLTESDNRGKGKHSLDRLEIDASTRDIESAMTETLADVDAAIQEVGGNELDEFVTVVAENGETEKWEIVSSGATRKQAEFRVKMIRKAHPNYTPHVCTREQLAHAEFNGLFNVPSADTVHRVLARNYQKGGGEIVRSRRLRRVTAPLMHNKALSLNGLVP